MGSSSFFVGRSSLVSSVFPGSGSPGSSTGGFGGFGMSAGLSFVSIFSTFVASFLAIVGPGFPTMTSSNSAPESSSFGGGGSCLGVNFLVPSGFFQVRHVSFCPVKMSSSKLGVVSGQFLPLSTILVESSKGSGDGSGFVAGLGAGAISFEGKSSLSAMILCLPQLFLPGSAVETRLTACISGQSCVASSFAGMTAGFVEVVAGSSVMGSLLSVGSLQLSVSSSSSFGVLGSGFQVSHSSSVSGTPLGVGPSFQVVLVFGSSIVFLGTGRKFFGVSGIFFGSFPIFQSIGGVFLESVVVSLSSSFGLGSLGEVCFSSGAQRADAIKLATIVSLCAFAGSSALFAIAVFDNTTDWVSKDRVSASEISARFSSFPSSPGTI